MVTETPDRAKHGLRHERMWERRRILTVPRAEIKYKFIPAHNQAPPHEGTQIMEVGLHTFLTSALNRGQFHAPVA
jgi:hypothetical protein